MDLSPYQHGQKFWSQARTRKVKVTTSQSFPSSFLNSQGCKNPHPHSPHPSLAEVGGLEKGCLAPSPPLGGTGRG